jgi:hypothetical protein
MAKDEHASFRCDHEPFGMKAIGLDAEEFKVQKFNVQQAVEKSKECFDKLSMNGNFSGNSNLSPFVLSASKDSERFFNRLSTTKHELKL